MNIENILVLDVLNNKRPQYNIDPLDEADAGTFILDQNKLIKFITEDTFDIPLHKANSLYENNKISKEVQEIIFEFLLNIRAFLNQEIIFNDSDLNFCLSSVNNYIICHSNFVSELGSYKNLRSITSSKLNENEFIIIPEPEFTGCCTLNEQSNSFGIFIIKKYIKRVQFIK